MKEQPKVGFTCAYTPVQMIHAAGFMPFRILPVTGAPDQAGSVLHDNLCPHVKRVLDRKMDGDLPGLFGVVLMNSCDAMRRMADAWQTRWPDDRVRFVDLPIEASAAAVSYMALELKKLSEVLSEWSCRPFDPAAFRSSVTAYNKVVDGLDQVEGLFREGRLAGGRRTFQSLLNRSVTGPPEETLHQIESLKAKAEDAPEPSNGTVRLLVFGNVLPEPEAFDLFEGFGAEVVADDLCTGSRQLARVSLDEVRDGDLFSAFGAALLNRPPCARTMEPGRPLSLAHKVRERASAVGAHGVVAHVIKFCDPYLSRLPGIRAGLKEGGLPLLILEGDCTLRSLGQHRTRIEAFVEMLQEKMS